MISFMYRNYLLLSRKYKIKKGANNIVSIYLIVNVTKAKWKNNNSQNTALSIDLSLTSKYARYTTKRPIVRVLFSRIWYWENVYIITSKDVKD